jgi:hypothetical protein
LLALKRLPLIVPKTPARGFFRAATGSARTVAAQRTVATAITGPLAGRRRSGPGRVVNGDA